MPESFITIGIIEGNSRIRSQLNALIHQVPQFLCIGSWSEGDSALTALTQNACDIILLDIHLPCRMSLPLLNSLSSLPCKILLMTHCMKKTCNYCALHSNVFLDEPSTPDVDITLALKSGAHGVIRKQCPLEVFIRAIQTLDSGQLWIDPLIARSLSLEYLQGFPPVELQEESDLLTLREKQLVVLVGKGYKNTEIAEELHIGYSTVKNSLSQILHKLNLRDRTLLALYAKERFHL